MKITVWTCRRNASGMISCWTKAWKSTKHLRLTAGPVDLAIRHRKSGKQMACTTTMIASFVEHRLAWACWARKLLPFSCLDRGFLIETDQPGACSQERSRPGHRPLRRAAPALRRQQAHGCAARHDSARGESGQL